MDNVVKFILFFLIFFTSSVQAKLFHTELKPRVSWHLRGSLEKVDRDLRRINEEYPKTGKAVAWCIQDSTLYNGNVYLNTQVNVPVWDDYKEASSPEQQKWDKFYNKCYNHELEHRDIAVRVMKEVSKIPSMIKFSEGLRRINYENYRLDLGLDPKHMYPLDED